MRNLKRALSLGLTATMISGLMVMGSSAASYADVTSKNHQEAIEVLKSVGIMTGDEKGNFNPEAKVTRNEMAVVMSNLMAYNVKTYANTSPFTDVPDWAEPYVAACYTNGITSGYDKVTYGGSDNVTTAQAALMVMKALGYFQFQSDFGADWQLSTVAQGNKIDLFEDVDSPVKEAINRNELAQLVLNALESGTVEADDNTIKVENGDTTVSAGKVKYNYITSTKDYAKAIKEVRSTSDTSDAGSYVVELGEKLYDGDLTKDRTGDDFGRPSNKWEYQAKEVGTYPDSADHTFTANVTSKALYNAIGKTAAENYDMNVYFNGEPVDKYGKGDLYKNKADDDSDFVAYADASDKALTANGVITEVFVDGTDEVVTVAIMEQYAAEVLKVDAEDGTITLSGLSEGKVVDAKDEFEATEFAEDDIVIYTYANDKIQSVYAAEKIEGDVTSVRINTDANADGKNTDPGDGDRFTVGGTTYKYNKTMAKADKLGTDNVNNGVVAYLDAQGYVAYIDESAITYDYAYVLSMGNDQDKFDQDSHKGTTYYARLVLTDGTIVKVETDNKSSLAGHIVSYSKDKKDVYSLTDRSHAFDLADATNLDVNNGKAGMTLVDSASEGKTSAVANANTVFIVAESDSESYDDYDFSVYTGVKNVPDIDGDADTKAVVALKDGSNVAKVVYIQDAEVSGATDVVFAYADKTPKYTKDKDGKIFEIDAIKDGEAITLKIKEGSAAAKKLVTFSGFTANTALSMGKAGEEYLVALKGITENADGYVTNVRLYDEDALANQTAGKDMDGVISGTGITDKSKDDVVTLTKVNGGSDKTYTWSDNVTVAQYNDKSDKGEFSKSKMSSIKADSNDRYLAVMDDGVIIGLLTEYVSGGVNDNNNNTINKGDYETSLNGTIINVRLVNEAATKMTVGREVNAILKEAGYKSAELDSSYAGGASSTATAKDSDGSTVYFNVNVTRYFTIKVDDEVKEYVAENGTSNMVEKDIKGNGDGYVTGTTYKAYSTTSSTAITTSTTAPVEIKTGYVALPTSVTGANSATIDPAAGYIEVSKTVTVKATFTADPAKDRTVTLTDDEGNVVATTVLAKTATDATLTFKADESISTLAAAAVVSYEVKTKVVETNANGLTVTLSAPKAAANGDKVTVTVTIKGQATAATKLTISGVTGTWSNAVKPDGATISGQDLQIANGTNYDGDGVTTRFTFTMGTADATATVTLDNQ